MNSLYLYANRPLEGATDEVDDVGRQVREVAEGLVLDLSVLSEGAAEIVTGVGGPLVGVGDFGDVDCAGFACHAAQYGKVFWTESRVVPKDFGYKLQPKPQVTHYVVYCTFQELTSIKPPV